MAKLLCLLGLALVAAAAPRHHHLDAPQEEMSFDQFKVGSSGT